MSNINHSHLIVKFDELVLKGKNRSDFSNQLFRTVKKKLTDFIVIKEYDKLVITNDEESIKLIQKDELTKVLKVIPGINSFIFVYKTVNIDEAKELIKSVVNNDFNTFKCVTKRRDKNIDMTSNELSMKMGEYILDNFENKKVNLANPEKIFNFELYADKIYVYFEVVLGIGGLPITKKQRALILLSGGIDSPVAAMKLMQRGIKVDFLNFETPPYTTLRTRNKIINIAHKLNDIQSDSNLYFISLTDFQHIIKEKTNERYYVTLLRRQMYRIAEIVANKYNYDFIATGENLNQVASQTINSLKVTDNAISSLVLRPLITYNKIEIINIAKQIGTYEISILPHEDTCTIFLPSNPITQPKLEDTIYEESKIIDLDEITSNSIESIEKVFIDN